jgi:hypothetical protein
MASRDAKSGRDHGSDVPWRAVLTLVKMEGLHSCEIELYSTTFLVWCNSAGLRGPIKTVFSNSCKTDIPRLKLARLVSLDR